MHASSFRFSLAHLCYALTLGSAATALFGGLGLPVAALILLVWWQVLIGRQRECERALAEELRIADERNPGSGRRRPGMLKTELLVALLGSGLLVGLLVPATQDSDEMRHAEISMKMVGLALAEYEREHGQPPPCVVYDSRGNPMHSWRALLLPYLHEPELAAAYHFDEAWDGPHNSELSQFRPWHFRGYYPLQNLHDTDTSMQLLDLGDSVVLCEHEGIISHWLQPLSSESNLLERFKEVPKVDRGFWRHGFFTSNYRGRLITSATVSYQVHPSSGQALTAALAAGTQPQLASQTDLRQQRIDIGQPVRRVHVGNLLRLLFFVFVAFFPVRWLKTAQ